MILADADLCENVSVQFRGNEHEDKDVRETIGTYAYVGKFEGSENAVFWKKTPTDDYIPSNKQFFIYHSGQNLIVQVGVLNYIYHDIYETFCRDSNTSIYYISKYRNLWKLTLHFS